MRKWWMRLHGWDRLLVVFLFALAVICLYFAFPFSHGDLPSHLVTCGEGLLIFSAMLLQGALGASISQRMRNAPLIAHHFLGAGAGIFLIGLLLMLTGPKGS